MCIHRASSLEPMCSCGLMAVTESPCKLSPLLKLLRRLHLVNYFRSDMQDKARAIHIGHVDMQICPVPGVTKCSCLFREQMQFCMGTCMCGLSSCSNP